MKNIIGDIMFPCPQTTFRLVVEEPMHAVARICHIEQTMVDTALQDHIRLTLELNKLAGGADGGEGKQIIQATTHGRQTTLVLVEQMLHGRPKWWQAR